ncbi:MAG: Uma2 family endonuclease [Bacteroidota bacterium]
MATVELEQQAPFISENVTDTDISLADFLRLYADVEDGYKYEYNNGKIEKTKSMDQLQIIFFDVLNRLFSTTTLYEAGGVFTQETDMRTSKSQLRRPDLAIYSFEQKIKMLKGENQVALWGGEVISSNDKANNINLKTEEYFNAGVLVVWNIYPASNQIYVYTSPEDVTICRGKTVCSGQPALPDFDISAEDLFAYKTMYLEQEKEK